MEKLLPIDPPPTGLVLLKFAGPFKDNLANGWCVGMKTEGGWWVSCIWAGSTPDREPIGYLLLPQS